MKRAPIYLIVSLLMMMMSAISPLIGQTTTSAAETVVPKLVNFSGKALDAQGKPVSGVAGITFAIYKDQTDGVPLWLETQNVWADSRGNYSVQLGATKPDGLALDLFESGEARWLGVRVNGGDEQPRVLLLSVPYALKAADAQTLGGLPPSAFVLAAPVNNANISSNGPGTSSILAQGSTVSSPSPTVGGSGTQNYIPLWTDSTGDLGNSILYQLGTGSSAKIGINLKNPLFTLDVNGQELVRGLFEMATTGYATATKAFNSNPFNIESSAFNSGTGKYTLNHFQWQAEPTGNNTKTPGATLNLLYGTDPNPPTETGLKLSSTGIFTFASGQNFPGTGTVTSVGISAPTSDFTVSGSPVTKTGTLGLNWTVAPTNLATANAIVKRDSTGSFSAGAINAGTLVASGQIFGESGISGTSSAIGVYGESDGSVSGNNGVQGVTYAGPGSGVAGFNNSSSGGIGVYGSGGSGSASTGVVGTGTTGVWGTGSSYGFATDSNVQQARSAGGWVKAMAYIQGMSAPYTITRCFNSTLAGAAATTPPCGFNLSELAPGDFALDFGFQVNDRFVTATADDADTACTMFAGAGPFVSSDTAAEVRCLYGGGINSYPFRASVFVF